MATATKVVITEVQEIEPEGKLDPDQIHPPDCFIDFLLTPSFTLRRFPFYIKVMNFRSLSIFVCVSANVLAVRI